MATGTELDQGEIAAGESVEVVSEMGNDGVVFADGMEGDYLEFISGQSVRLSTARVKLNLLMPA